MAQHPFRDIHADDFLRVERQRLNGKVARTRRDVEEGRRPVQKRIPQKRHRAFPPPHVDAHREHAVQQVVTRRDVVEHGLDLLTLAFCLPDGGLG